MIQNDAEYKAYTVARLAGGDFLELENYGSFFGDIFHRTDAMIFVCACGIAVRKIAPFIRDKKTDPAVICIDDSGEYVIPVLSGHIGGANRLAAKIAEITGGTAVITTATDINDRFSVDTWAVNQGYSIGDMVLAKKVSATILEKDIPICSEYPIAGDCPNGLYPGKAGDIGIYVGNRINKPFDDTLNIIPRNLYLGIGCRRGTDAETIRAAVDEVLVNNGIDKRAIKEVVTIELKKDEEGLIKFCESNSWELVFYSGEQLKQAEGDFTSSEFVLKVTGVDNVCERAAMMRGEKLIVEKTSAGGVTVAIAEEKTEVRFE